MNAPHARAIEEVLAALESSSDGLSEEEAGRRLASDGPNRLTARRGRGVLRRMLEQLAQPLIIVLVAAAVVSAALGDHVDAAVIAAVVVINAVIGFVQESRAEGAIQALDALVVAQATVVRSGLPRRIPGESLVRGDVVSLQSGDAVPADLRLLSVRELRVDEAALTGESVPVRKEPAELPADTVLADRRNLTFAGTLVTYGQARGVVIATGDATETGKIAGLIASTQDLATPLTRRLAALSQLLLWVILGAAAVMFALEAVRGRDLGETFGAAVAFAVGAIPEGLPAAVTVLLAVGVSHMARRGAIIRRLPAVETLGSTTVICSDKTGTLTENQMTVTRLWTLSGLARITGTGYEPTGGFERDGRPVVALEDEALREAARCAGLCQDTRLRREAGVVHVEGDPTEAALIVLAQKAGLLADALAAWRRVDALPFESQHMYMATLHAGPDGAVLYVKGSTDALLPRCTSAVGPSGIASLDREAIQREVAALGTAGLRVLCLALRRVRADQTTVGHDDVQDLTFLGLAGMIDPPRPEARKAIATCHGAGIRVKMITGDHAVTAAAIAHELGLEGRRGPDGRLVAVTGRELVQLRPPDRHDRDLRGDEDRAHGQEEGDGQETDQPVGAVHSPSVRNAAASSRLAG